MTEPYRRWTVYAHDPRQKKPVRSWTYESEPEALAKLAELERDQMISRIYRIQALPPRKEPDDNGDETDPESLTA